MAEKGPWEDYAAPEAGPWSDYQSSGFDKAIAPLLKREGGYVNDPDDKGGETKFGISKRAYPNVDIASLTEEDAKAIYRRDYWDKIGADNLSPEVQEVAFDAAVNHGVGWVKKNLSNDVDEMISRRRSFYDSIIQRDPSQAKFKNGWENRMKELSPPWHDF